MALVAIAERRVVPGRTAAYLSALRAFSQTLAFVEGRGELRAVVEDSDPDRVLVLGRWTSRPDYEGAMPRLSPALIAEAESHIQRNARPLRWYRIAREIERMAVRPGYVVAGRYRIGGEAWEPFERWIVDTMRQRVALPGVVSQALLVDLDDPTAVVSLVQYTSPEAIPAADQRVAALPPPPELGDIATERFAGRTDLLWRQRAD